MLISETSAASRLILRNHALDSMGELFATPSSWIQGTEAMTTDDQDITPTHPDAACWCLTGAAIRVAEERHGLLITDILSALWWGINGLFPARAEDIAADFRSQTDKPTLDRLLIEFNDSMRTSAQEIRTLVSYAKGCSLS